MTFAPGLLIACALAGLIIAASLVFFAPRLAAHRLSEPPAYPPPIVLIPLVGAVGSGWRPVRSIITEILTACVFVLLAVHFGQNRKLPIVLLYTTLLLAMAYIDLDYRLVLNRLSYPSFVIAVGCSLLWPGMGPVSSLLGAASGLAIFVVFQVLGRGALGTGDTKLAIVIGAMTGFPAALNALLLGVILGGLGALIALGVLRRGRKEYIAYAPYLAAGAVLSFFLS